MIFERLKIGEYKIKNDKKDKEIIKIKITPPAYLQNQSAIAIVPNKRISMKFAEEVYLLLTNLAQKTDYWQASRNDTMIINNYLNRFIYKEKNKDKIIKNEQDILLKDKFYKDLKYLGKKETEYLRLNKKLHLTELFLILDFFFNKRTND